MKQTLLLITPIRMDLGTNPTPSFFNTRSIMTTVAKKVSSKYNVLIETVCNECGMIQNRKTQKVESSVFTKKMLEDPAQNYITDNGNYFSRVFVPSCRYC